ncbi:PREDICTED: dnaJ homolog subfamily B member 4 [Tarenaya hassleriana]|uniref:dnaJ homolog subfamily B member 4 n=1 Tax=Tarenaya hassleriana TaxID=28532 RepID=UPI00053CA26A|nr:PREDICTED: dnaJ homolog subfamily B member 4 [Tarenaya hassleriana]
MATQGVPKKKSFLLRDVVKLCRSIAKLWPRDKNSKLSSCSSFDFDTKTKLKTKSKRKDHHHHVDVRDVKDLPSQILQEAKADAKEEGVRLCRVHSYRYDRTDDFVRNKKLPLSRSCSQNMPMRRNSSSFTRSKSSCNRTDATSRFAPSFTRTAGNGAQRSFTNPILYSSSTATAAKPPPTEEELICTLEELCKGCTKKIKIKRDVMTSSGEVSREEEMVEIKVEPGWKGGTKVTFEGKGNEAMGSAPADLTFVITEKEHDLFTREGDDLEMEVEIPLVEALTGCEISVQLLDGDNINLRIDDVIHHGYTMVIQGKGMPRAKEKEKRGDLMIKFWTKFPRRLSDYQRAEIRNILQGSST